MAKMKTGQEKWVKSILGYYLMITRVRERIKICFVWSADTAYSVSWQSRAESWDFFSKGK